MGEPSAWRLHSARGAATRDLAAREVLDGQRSTVSTHGAEAVAATEAPARAAPADVPLEIPDLLALLPELEVEIEAGERRLRECVRLLRAHRATWREIGDALQVSRQAAWERFRTS